MSALGQKRTFCMRERCPLYPQKRTFLLGTWLVSGWFRRCSPHHAEGAIAASGGGHAGLDVAIIRMTPASTFKETVCGRNPTQGDAIGQITARVNLPPPKLAHI